MGTRTVRLDDESEQLLRLIQKATGTTVSGALKRGLVEAARQVREEATARPFDLFARLDLGEGGYAVAPARRAKAGVRKVLARKRR